MKTTIKDLIDISAYAGNRVDYTQGGGGNTSVKNFSNGTMLIKASGYKLKDITETTAFVAVDRNKIADYYSSVDLTVEKDYEKESAALAKNSVIPIAGMDVLRPSVEVGFHAILKKYVIHTHSVYGNLLTCAVEGGKIAEKLFKDKDYGYIFLPYINPGFELTLAMMKGIEKYQAENGRYPEVIFMKNHGLVVNGDYIDRVKAVNTDVNEMIRKYFGIPDDFREISLTKTPAGYCSDTKVVKSFVAENELDKKYLDDNPLYPDQLVYLNNILLNSPDTLVVNKGNVYYNTDIKQATTLDETLAAYLFIMVNLKKNGLTVSKMNEREVAFINGWEAEKYRRSVK